MHIKLKITETQIKIISIVLIIFVSIHVLMYAHDQYLIHKTRQTLNIMRGAYVRTILNSRIKWTEQTMNTDIFARAFVRELPVKKDCGYDSSDNTCFPKIINFQKPLPDTDVKRTGIGGYYKVKLKNGVGIAFTVLSPDCKLKQHRCGTVFIDINGTNRGPNTFGKDLYDFSINEKEITTYPMKSAHIPRCLAGTGQGCADYMLKFRTLNFKKYAKKAATYEDANEKADKEILYTK